MSCIEWIWMPKTSFISFHMGCFAHSVCMWLQWLVWVPPHCTPFANQNPAIKHFSHCLFYVIRSKLTTFSFCTFSQLHAAAATAGEAIPNEIELPLKIGLRSHIVNVIIWCFASLRFLSTWRVRVRFLVHLSLIIRVCLMLLVVWSRLTYIYESVCVCVCWIQVQTSFQVSLSDAMYISPICISISFLLSPLFHSLSVYRRIQHQKKNLTSYMLDTFN